MIKIILTGGGSAGHVTPNLALIPRLKQLDADAQIHYIGSADGIERDIIAKTPGITYHPIRTGKLRRYFSLKNFTDPFRVIGGYHDAKKIIKELRPDLVFSKGGFVSVPVAAAAHHYKIPVVSHESDITPGLANRIAKKYATKICLTFPDTLKQIAPPLGVCTGSPIREELFHGDPEKARKMLGFDQKPVILVMGGSLGAKSINQAVRGSLKTLTARYNIIHLCGRNNLDSTLQYDVSPAQKTQPPDAPAQKSAQTDRAYLKSYAQFEFISEELPDFLALADFVVSRAGSNAIHEFLALHKPMLLIPLSLEASRGDQILNAASFEKRGFAIVLRDEKLSPQTLVSAIGYLEKDQSALIEKMKAEPNTNGVGKIIGLIKSLLPTLNTNN